MQRKSNTTELMRRSFIELMKDVGTSIPGHVLAFDPSTQLAQIQIGIQRVDVNGEAFEPAPLIECPVYFAGGNEWLIEHKVVEGDECLVVFSQRCIDAWKDSGGIAVNPIARYHSMNDACVLPGLRSQVNAISNFANNGLRLRNGDASVYLWLKDDNTVEITNGTTTFTLAPDGTNTLTNGSGTITMESGGTVDINGATIDPTGAIVSPTSVTAPNIAASTSLTVNSVEMDQHTHGIGDYLDAEDRPLNSGNSGPAA